MPHAARQRRPWLIFDVGHHSDAVVIRTSKCMRIRDHKVDLRRSRISSSRRVAWLPEVLRMRGRSCCPAGAHLAVVERSIRSGRCGHDSSELALGVNSEHSLSDESARPTRRQSQRRDLSRLVHLYLCSKVKIGILHSLLHEARQLPPWLIFDVRQNTSLL